MSVKRFSERKGMHNGRMVCENPHGQYVLYTDYEKVAATLHALQAAVVAEANGIPNDLVQQLRNATAVLSEPTPPSPPQPKELCECGHRKATHDVNHGACPLFACPCTAFKPAQAIPHTHGPESCCDVSCMVEASKEACPHGCVDGVVKKVAKGIAWNLPCPDSTHWKAVCPNGCVNGRITQCPRCGDPKDCKTFGHMFTHTPCPIHGEGPKCPHNCVDGTVNEVDGRGPVPCTWEGHSKPGTGTAGREGAEG